MSFRVIALSLALGFAAATAAAQSGSVVAELRSPEQMLEQTIAFDSKIRRGLTLNAEGRFDEALALWEGLRREFPRHPAPDLHEVDTRYWLMVYDDLVYDQDDAIERVSKRAIKKAEDLVEARPHDAEAHFFLGQGLMNLGRIYGVRMRIFRAGRLAERARESLERSLELDPNLVDARYSLGLYFYFASFLPDIVQWLSFLGFIPTGTAEQGIQNLEEVVRHGDRNQFAAEFMISNIVTYHEKRIDHPRAFEMIHKLHSEYPRNTLIHFELLEVLAVTERPGDVIREALILEANPGTSKHDVGRKEMARIWRARAEFESGHSDKALELLEVFESTGPVSPTWGHVYVQVTRGQISDVRGDREQALAEYRAVIDKGYPPEFSRATEMAMEGLESPYRHPTGLARPVFVSAPE
jgi:tetratricopeptide (TPR) repeat protein